jgi:hypothetical protein
LRFGDADHVSDALQLPVHLLVRSQRVVQRNSTRPQLAGYRPCAYCLADPLCSGQFGVETGTNRTAELELRSVPDRSTATLTPLIGAFVVFPLISGVNPSAFVDMQYSVDMAHDQHVYYSRGATRDDAQRFGEALETEGYFDGTTPADVLISGKAGAREISFFGGGGVWEDESYVEAVRAMAERIAPAIGGNPSRCACSTRT